MAPSRVTDVHVIDIWGRMEAKSLSLRIAKDMFRVGQHVRISKEKMRFAKAAEHNCSTEMFGSLK
jgi:hypothetical protein